jgi:hypothetical protein
MTKTMTARSLLATAVLVSLLGCATTPVSTSSARNVPAERVLNASLLKPKDGYGQVIIKRDAGLPNPFCKVRVFANGTPVADMDHSEKIVFYLPEGEQMLAAGAHGFCADVLVEIMALVSRSRPAVFRISGGNDGEFYIQPTAF